MSELSGAPFSAVSAPPDPGNTLRARVLRWRVPVASGLASGSLLLAVYFSALALVSGWEFTLAEFARYWPFIVTLALGFGVQVALFVRLRRLVAATQASGTVIAASGTSSTAAMVSCCAHYLANVTPFLGTTGLVALAAQFQVELLWIGLLFSAAGVAFVWSRLQRAEREHSACEA